MADNNNANQGTVTPNVPINEANQGGNNKTFSQIISYQNLAELYNY